MSDAKPIIVDPNVTGEAIAMGVRQVALVGGGFVSAAGFVHSHDWGGFFGYLAGDGFTAATVATLTIGVFVYGQFKLWRDKHDAVRMARSADNSVAIVKGDPA